jgi:hypothetical protein
MNLKALAIAAIALLLTACGSESPTGTDDPTVRNWTLMLYDDADFPGYDPFDHFRLKTCSGEHVNVLVLQDSLGGGAKLVRVKHDHSLKVLEEMGEINMGDPDVLVGFLTYAKENYPARGYVLSVYDHGGGWRGSCWDATSGNDNLTMDEMARALKSAGGVDIIMFSAPCLMGSLESVYELRDCVDYYIAAEDLSGYCWWVHAMGDICMALDDDGPPDTEGVVGEVIQAIWRYRYGSCSNSSEEEVQMAAIRARRIGPLVEAIDSLSVAYLNDMTRFRYHMELALDSVEVMSYEYADVYDMACWLRRFAYKPEIRGALDLVKAAALDAVFAECHGEYTFDQHGLSLYLPLTRWTTYDTLYGSDDIALDLARDTHWDELLRASKTGATGPALRTFRPEGDGWSAEVPLPANAP